MGLAAFHRSSYGVVDLEHDRSAESRAGAVEAVSGGLDGLREWYGLEAGLYRPHYLH